MDRLTRRERAHRARRREIIALRLTGNSVRRIASKTGLSENTIRKHLSACGRSFGHRYIFYPTRGTGLFTDAELKTLSQRRGALGWESRDPFHLATGRRSPPSLRHVPRRPPWCSCPPGKYPCLCHCE